MDQPQPSPPSWTPDLEAHLRASALAAGFDLFGIAPALTPDDEAGQVTADRFTQWIDQGRAGEMDYLKRRDEHGELLRRSVRVPMPWARSVLVCAFNYNAAAPKSIDPAPPDAAWIARYAWSGTATGDPLDYHDDLLARLKQVEAALQTQAPCTTRCYVDTGPLLERDLASKAGIGWVGKNTCVLNQQQGSWLLLGVIVTSIPLATPALEAPRLEIPDRCGSCTRCIDACPTDALIAPRQMDASLCIAYLTIEHKGSIAEELRAPMGRQVFGCDICQDVCPWNRRAPIATHSNFTARADLINPTLESLAQMDPAEFRRRFRGSPLERTKLKRLRRNVAIAMGNTADPAHRPHLEAWSTSDDPVLAEAALWALARLK